MYFFLSVLKYLKKKVTKKPKQKYLNVLIELWSNPGLV